MFQVSTSHSSPNSYPATSSSQIFDLKQAHDRILFIGNLIWNKKTLDDVLRYQWKEAADEIGLEYEFQLKNSFSDCLDPHVMLRRREIVAIYKGVINLLFPSQLPFIIPGKTRFFTSHLTISELAVLALVNRQGNKIVKRVLRHKAVNLGFGGKYHKRAMKYLAELFSSIKQIRMILPASLRPKEPEEILESLDLLSTSHLFGLIPVETIHTINYGQSCAILKIIKMLIPTSNLPCVDLLRLSENLNKWAKTIQDQFPILKSLGSVFEIEIYNIYEDICSLVNYNALPFMCRDLSFTLNIMRFLKMSEIHAFFSVSHHGKIVAESALLDRAIKFGFKGNDQKRAVTYLKSKFEVVRSLYIHDVIHNYLFCLREYEHQGTLMTKKEGFIEHFTTLSLLELSSLFVVRNGIFKHEGIIEIIKCVKPIKENLGDLANIEVVKAVVLAIQNSSLAILEILLEKGANPNFAFSNGSFPIHFAVQKGCIRSVKLLLEHGAKMNLLGIAGSSVLLWACGYWNSRPHLQIIQFLLEKGADPFTPNNDGVTPLGQLRLGFLKKSQKQHSNTLRFWQEAFMFMETYMKEKKALKDRPLRLL